MAQNNEKTYLKRDRKPRVKNNKKSNVISQEWKKEKEQGSRNEKYRNEKNVNGRNRSEQNRNEMNGNEKKRNEINASEKDRNLKNGNPKDGNARNRATDKLIKNTDRIKEKNQGNKQEKYTGNKPEKYTGNKPEYNTRKNTNKNESKYASKNESKYADKNIGEMKDRKNNTKNRTEGTCPHRRDCGSCRIHEKSYKEHLAEKQKMVKELISTYCPVEPIIGMEDPTHYRNKVHAVFDRDRRGNAISGVYEEGTHRVVPIESCLIHNQKADEIIASIRGLLKSFKIKTYDEDTGYGLLRHVLIRTGYHSKEIMVVLVIGSPIFPSKNNFVKAIRQLHPEISTIVINVNDKNTSMVLGEKEQVIYGKGYIEDTLCEKVFRISPKSFYQVNPTQTEKLYRLAIKMAQLTGKETVLDAYCGIGTIGLIASDKASKVIGVELNKDAVADARVNAKRNDTSNIQFYLKDAGEFMAQLAEQNEAVDVVFMDPPRAGSDEKFLDSLAILKPKKVVYISCNPVTLQRDVAYLTKKGYRAERAVPVDMFPWTNHVETCCLLYKVK